MVTLEFISYLTTEWFTIYKSFVVFSFQTGINLIKKNWIQYACHAFQKEKAESQVSTAMYLEFDQCIENSSNKRLIGIDW